LADALDEDAAETLRVDHLRQLQAVRASGAAVDPELESLRLREVVRSTAAAGGSNLVQARLALAAQLRSQGHLRDAYLEALLALAVARSRADDAAVRAAAQLLAALTRSAGFEQPAESWDELAARHESAAPDFASES
jgi:hypothetical protein